MNKTATLLLVGVIAAVAPAIGYGESRVYVPPKDSKSQLGYRDISGLNWREISKHYAPAKSIEDWRKLHSERHWKKGYSAHQIAHAWENANPKLPREIAALFYGPVELLAAIPEHKTPLPGGRAPSQSDLLVFVRIKNRVCAVTVEGKKDEGFGTTVGEWSKNASAGKIKRLKHIAAKLGLAYPPTGEIRYQLLHRTASAVIEAGRFNADCAATLVHSFSPQHESFGDFATFLSAFGIRSAKRDKIYKTTKPGIDLYFGWASPPGTVAVAETPAPQPKPAKPAPTAPAKPAPQQPKPQPAQTTSADATTATVAPSPEPAKPKAQQPKQQPEVVVTAPVKPETRPAEIATPPKIDAPSIEVVAPATPKPETPVPAKPKPQPERAAETTVAADVTAPESVTPTPAKPARTAPEKAAIVVEQKERISAAPAQTPPAQATTTDTPEPSWFGANLFWILLAAALVVAPTVVWMLRKKADTTRQIHRKLDKIIEEKDVSAATTGSKPKLTKAEKDSIQKGREFEDFIVEMFHKDDDYFTLMSRSADKFTDTGVSAKDSTDPDLKYNFLSRGRTYPFAVECKWRQKFWKEREIMLTSSPGQLQRYKSYERHTKDKTFIVLGVDGSAGNPEHLFVIPVSDIQNPTLTKKELLPFYQRSTGHFTYDPENKVLKMVSD